MAGFIVGYILGALSGVILVCLVQIGRIRRKDQDRDETGQ